MLFKMLGITFLLFIISTFSLVGSAYYSDKKDKLGRFLWKTSLTTSFLYGLSVLATLGVLVTRFLEFIF